MLLPSWFIFVGVAIRFFGGLLYASAVIKKRAKPNPISWFFWALTPVIIFTAQLTEQVGWSLLVTFALGIGPTIVFILSLFYSLNKSHFTPATITCGILAIIGIVLWLSTNNPLLAIIFSILADICASLPTVLKTYRDPGSEVALPYFLSTLSMVITLLSLTNWSLASYVFPLYIFTINAIILAAFLQPGRKKTLRRKQT